MRILTLTFLLVFCIGIGAQTATLPSIGDGTAGNPYQISTLNHLYWIAADITRWNKQYLQTANIDASATAGWFDNGTGGYFGWLPIGNATTKFTGRYNGGGYSISSLYSNRPSTAYVALFGYTSGATISNLQLLDVNITGLNNVGACIGMSNNTATSSCSSSGIVNGTAASQTTVGGLVGQNYTSSVMDACSSSCTVTGAEVIGGLVGGLYSSIVQNSHSTGTVSGGTSIGGLAGKTSATSTCRNSYSTGNVTGSNINVGGLVGWNTGISTIDTCYSTGVVTGTGTADTNGLVGGLVGENYSASAPTPSIIRDSYSTSTVSGSFRVGGLVGRNNNSTISNSYSTGSATGRTYTGGFIGANTGSGSSIDTCYSTGIATSNTSHCGGFAGWNGSSATIQNSFSRGNVKRSSGGTAAQYGGFAGYNESTISYSYSTGKVEWLATSPVNKGFCGSVGVASSMSTCYWDIQTSLQTSSSGNATGKTTAEMIDALIYNSMAWDMTTIWVIEAGVNGGYPYLRTNPTDITLPVELSSFTGLVTQDDNIRLNWITQSETGVSGYYIYRAVSDQLSDAILISALIPATNSSVESSYSFTDRELTAQGSYYYWLQNLDLDGRDAFHGPVLVSFQPNTDPLPEIPVVTGITRLYPNPFNPTLYISYVLKDVSDVDVSVFNIKGQLLKNWHVPNQKAGNSRLQWDAPELPGGVYLLQFTAGKTREMRRVTILK